MAVDIDLIRAYTDGLVAVAPTGTALPTDPDAALNVAFAEVGAVSSDGLTEATEQDVTDIFIWQKNALARRIKGNFVKTFQFAAAETNLVTLGVQYPGSTVTQTAYGASIAEKPPVTDIRSWVLHGLDGVRKQRIVIPNGEVTERGEVVWSSENITVYQWTDRKSVV